jgi:PadR family transcriptional regulator, regulatory protein PadR
MKDLHLGEFEELVLLVVAALHSEAYGVSIFESLEASTGRRYNISAIHVVLKRLEDKGLVDSHFGGITEERGGRRKKFYKITAFGRKALDAQYQLRTGLYELILKGSIAR